MEHSGPSSPPPPLLRRARRPNHSTPIQCRRRRLAVAAAARAGAAPRRQGRRGPDKGLGRQGPATCLQAAAPKCRLRGCGESRGVQQRLRPEQSTRLLRSTTTTTPGARHAAAGEYKQLDGLRTLRRPAPPQRHDDGAVAAEGARRGEGREPPRPLQRPQHLLGPQRVCVCVCVCVCPVCSGRWR